MLMKLKRRNFNWRRKLMVNVMCVKTLQICWFSIEYFISLKYTEYTAMLLIKIQVAFNFFNFFYLSAFYISALTLLVKLRRRDTLIV